MGFAFLILLIQPALREHGRHVFGFGVGLGHSNAHFSNNGGLCRATALQELASLIRNPPLLAPGAPMALPPWQGSIWSGQISLFLWQAGWAATTGCGPFGVSQTCRNQGVLFFERLLLLWHEVGLEFFKFKNFGTGFCWQVSSFSRLPAWTTLECMGLRRISPALLPCRREFGDQSVCVA
jgi:hypothetical protein